MFTVGHDSKPECIYGLQDEARKVKYNSTVVLKNVTKSVIRSESIK
jgi:hypothetical protein